MVTFESSIGTVASSAAPLKRYVVDDPTAAAAAAPVRKEEPQIPQAQVEQPRKLSEEEIWQKYNDAKRERKEISPDKRRKIEALLGLRKVIKTINIDGMNFSMRNLCANDTRVALKSIAEHSTTNVDLMFYSRNVYVALTLYEINGESVAELLDENNGVDIELRLSLIEEMDEGVVKSLYDFYTKEIGISIPQTIEDVREVQAEIKK